jgi:CspA family cold shock protein
MRKLEQLYFKSLEFSDQRLDLLRQSSSQRMPPSAGASTADAAARVRQRNTAVYYSVIACDQVAGQNNITRIVTGEVEMARGTVKWFNPTKGYGFIQPQAGGKDVFVHISAVERAGLSTLNEGQHLEYEIEENRGKTWSESQG